MNQYQQDILDFFVMQLGKPYVFGAIGPDEWDCRGLDRKGARYAGLDATVFPAVNTVREMFKWAQDNGHFRDASVTPEPGWFFIWGDPATGKPIKGNGHTGVVEEAPSAEHPNGLAISAYNPRRGVIRHRLIPKKKSGKALLGYVVLPWPQAEPPLGEPETPPDDEAIEPEGTLLDDLKALIAKYDA